MMTSALQELINEAIKTHGSIENYLEHAKAREKLYEFNWAGMDEAALGAKYANADGPIFRQISPGWDLRRSALVIGDMASQLSHSTIPLYLATRESFLCNSLYGDAEIGMLRGMKAKFLRVIGHWERGDALTPPLMTMWGDKLSKWDGHHRIMITLMSGADVIPFYSADDFSFPGIVPADSAMHSELCWRAKA